MVDYQSGRMACYQGNLRAGGGLIVRHAGYQYLLLGILILYLLIIVVPIQQVGGPLRVSLLGVLLLMAIRTGRRAGTLATPTLIIVVLAVAATVVAAIAGNETVLTCVSQAATVVLVAAMMAVLARTLIGAGVIDGPAVRGVLCIYLLLGLLFSAAHGFAAALISNYLDGVNGEPTQSDTLYFSLITLTTVGYGDITPAANVARAIAATEAITGQLYLVSVVAAVVSRYQSSRHARVKASDPGKEDPTDSHVPDSPGTHDGDDATT